MNKFTVFFYNFSLICESAKSLPNKCQVHAANTLCSKRVFDNKKLLVRSKNELSFLCKQVKGNFLIEGIWQALV